MSPRKRKQKGNAVRRSLAGVPPEWRAMIELAKPSLLAMLPVACERFDVSLHDIVVLIADLKGSVGRKLAEAATGGDTDEHIREAKEGGFPPIFVDILPPETWRPFLEDQLPEAIAVVDGRAADTLPITIVDACDRIHVLCVPLKLARIPLPDGKASTASN